MPGLLSPRLENLILYPIVDSAVVCFFFFPSKNNWVRFIGSSCFVLWHCPICFLSYSQQSAVPPDVFFWSKCPDWLAQNTLPRKQSGQYCRTPCFPLFSCALHWERWKFIQQLSQVFSVHWGRTKSVIYVSEHTSGEIKGQSMSLKFKGPVGES